ncbi:hypothetical protein AB4144_54455, partial [Rhizobiaceae sp. 2RAB30]
MRVESDREGDLAKCRQHPDPPPAAADVDEHVIGIHLDLIEHAIDGAIRGHRSMTGIVLNIRLH